MQAEGLVSSRNAENVENMNDEARVDHGQFQGSDDIGSDG